MPPRHGKSEGVSKWFPAWFLGRNPDEENNPHLIRGRTGVMISAASSGLLKVSGVRGSSDGSAAQDRVAWWLVGHPGSSRRTHGCRCRWAHYVPWREGCHLRISIYTANHERSSRQPRHPRKGSKMVQVDFRDQACPGRFHRPRDDQVAPGKTWRGRSKGSSEEGTGEKWEIILAPGHC